MLTRISGAIATLAFTGLAGLILYCVGRPLFADDLWWHLALGQAYASEGPWLASDPLLFSAEGPPLPAAWLFDLGLYSLLELGGFPLLRALHVALVLAILGLAFRTLRDLAGSTALASLGTGSFVVLAAYRLIQLRPELVTILLTLILARLLLRSADRPGTTLWQTALLSALWVNLHAGFLLGPVLIGVSLASAGAAQWLQPAAAGPRDWRPTRRFAAMLAVSACATLLNPSGLGPHLAYFAAGSASPDLAVVGDEWSRMALFSWPPPGTQPALLVWGLIWVLLAATAAGGVLTLRDSRAPAQSAAAGPRLVLLGLAVAGLAASLVAVRFTWLAFFACAFALRLLGGVPKQATAAFAALASVLLVPGFLLFGDWSFTSRGVPSDLAGYSKPYPAHKYFARAAWFLRDAGLEGRTFTSYAGGGFYGWWLSPRITTLVNGTLNVPVGVMDDYLAIQTGYGLTNRRELLERLDRHGIDLFVGVGMPAGAAPGRPWRYTTSHLEDAPGWRLAYRSMNCAVYVRAERTDLLARIERYYAERRVPFDAAQGLRVREALQRAPAWAIEQGLVPKGFLALRTRQEPGARYRIAGIYASLGLYAEAIDIDRELVAHPSLAAGARKRLVWSLLRSDALEEAVVEAATLPEGLRDFTTTAAAMQAMQDPEERALARAFLPLFDRAEASWTAAGLEPVPVRQAEERGAVASRSE